MLKNNRALISIVLEKSRALIFDFFFVFVLHPRNTNIPTHTMDVVAAVRVMESAGFLRNPMVAPAVVGACVAVGASGVGGAIGAIGAIGASGAAGAAPLSVLGKVGQCLTPVVSVGSKILTYLSAVGAFVWELFVTRPRAALEPIFTYVYPALQNYTHTAARWAHRAVKTTGFVTGRVLGVCFAVLKEVCKFCMCTAKILFWLGVFLFILSCIEWCVREFSSPPRDTQFSAVTVREFRDMAPNQRTEHLVSYAGNHRDAGDWSDDVPVRFDQDGEFNCAVCGLSGAGNYMFVCENGHGMCWECDARWVASQMRPRVARTTSMAPLNGQVDRYVAAAYSIAGPQNRCPLRCAYVRDGQGLRPFTCRQSLPPAIQIEEDDEDYAPLAEVRALNADVQSLLPASDDDSDDDDDGYDTFFNIGR